MDNLVIYRTFGRSLAQRRAAAGHSQDELAKRVGMSRASVANIEAGRQNVYLHQILAFAAALNLGDARELLPNIISALDHSSEARIDTTDKLSKAERARASSIFNSVGTA